ncbi:hypothetical protein GF373_06525, partial [bacterium]|nr:hypothetical protein [bacterium]
MDWFRIDLTDSKFYSQNMEALQTRYPQKAAWLSTWESAVDELEVTRHEGSFACRHATHGFLFYTPERFIKQQQIIVDRVTTLFQRGAQMWFVCGTGLGYVSSHLQKQYHGNLTKGFVLLENRPALILAQFALFDCKNFISSTQTYWGIGEDIFAELQAIIEEERLYGLPESAVFFYPERELDETERALYQKAGRWFLNYKRSKQEQVDSARKHFAERMGQPANLKSGTIWAVATPQAYAHTPLMHSLMSGFASLGWNKKVLELKEGFSTRLRVSADLVETAPDAVLCCNSASGTYVSPQVRRPRISWILDHPRYFGSDSLVNDLIELDHIVYCDRSYAPHFTHLPVASYQFLPVTPMVTRKGIQK